ncbi:hypothetical protein ACFX2I_024729 [Malus domestica]
MDFRLVEIEEYAGVVDKGGDRPESGIERESLGVDILAGTGAENQELPSLGEIMTPMREFSICDFGKGLADVEMREGGVVPNMDGLLEVHGELGSPLGSDPFGLNLFIYGPILVGGIALSGAESLPLNPSSCSTNLVLSGAGQVGRKRGRLVKYQARDETSSGYKKLCSNLSVQGVADEVELEVRSSSPNHIDLVCREVKIVNWWRLTRFHGHPMVANKHLSWSLLSSLGQQGSLPWLCLGDFNEIIHSCQLVDMGYVGNDYTWMDTWMDNREDELRLGVLRWNDQGRGGDFILKKCGCKGKVCKKIRAMHMALLRWQRNVFGSMRLEIARVREQLGVLFELPLLVEVRKGRGVLISHMDVLLSRDETFWGQRYKTHG